jgi:hypothetical protein
MPTKTTGAVTAPNPVDHLLQRSLGEGRDADSGVHVGHRDVHKVAAVATDDGHVPSEDHFISKIWT